MNMQLERFKTDINQLFSMFENGKGPEVRSFGIGLMLN
jgi:hypothetical protein